MSDGDRQFEEECRRAALEILTGFPLPGGSRPREEAWAVARETLREFGQLQAGNLNQHRKMFGELRRRAQQEWEVLRVAEDGDVHGS